jgi:F-type H+-transporting ATPase subunit b
MDIQLPQLLFQIVNFSVVLGALVFLLYKPIQKILDERANRVAESLKEVDAIQAEKEKLEAMKAKASRDAKKEAAAILEDAQKLAVKRKQESALEAKAMVAKEISKAEARWQAEKRQLLESSKKQMIDAVIQTSGLVIGKKLEKAGSEKLIAQGLTEVLRSV